MRNLPVLAVLLASYTYCFVIAQDDSEIPEAELEITPKEEEQTHYVHEGSNTALTCRTKNMTPGALVKDISWVNNQGERIGVGDKISVVSLSRKKKEKELILNIQSVTNSADGRYTCKVEFESGKVLEKNVDIKVIKEVSWLSESHYTVYEGNNRVEIECSATGIPEPDVNIMPFSGQQFDDTVEVISDSKIAIPDAIPGTTATRFLCKAIQAMDTASFVTLKTVHLDIRYGPRFTVSDSTKSIAYGIIERNATLACAVASANPSDVKFSFYRKEDGFPVKIESGDDDEKYEILIHNDSIRSDLMIKRLTEVDFNTEYSCVAENVVAKKTLDFQLEMISPPAQMQASFSHSNEHIVTFSFTDPDNTGNEKVPITDYKVEYWKFKPDEEPPAYPRFIILRKVPDGSYSVTSLDLDTEYSFRIAAGNPAGYGVPVQLNARTKPRGYSAIQAKKLQDKANTGCPAKTLSLFLSLVPTLLSVLLFHQ